MALATFIVLASIWLVGLTVLELDCARLEAPFDLGGELGAFIGTGWMRGSTRESRRCRRRALTWAGVGVAVIVLATLAVRSLESGGA